MRVLLSFSDTQSTEAQLLGVESYRSFEASKFLEGLDVVVIAAPLIEFEDSISSLPVDALRGKLVVDTCVLSVHPKEVMLRSFGSFPDIDLLCSHPMMSASKNALGSGLPLSTVTANADGVANDPFTAAQPTWDGLPFVYEKVRIADGRRCERFLRIFSEARCRMVEMTAEQHDESIADAEFVTHLTGRLLVKKQLLPPTPVVSKEYAALSDVTDMIAGDSFDLFFGMYKFNDRAKIYLAQMRDNLAALERQLAAKEAYLEARTDMKNSDRQRLLSETRRLLQDATRNGGLWDSDSSQAANGNAASASIDKTPP
jgi:arogenate dehydrogenase (NADP+), plant